MLRSGFAVLVAAAFWPALLLGQQSPPAWADLRELTDSQLKGLRAPQAIKVELAGQRPALPQPRQLAFGDDGTLYVLAAARAGEKSRLLSLADKNKDGQYDESQSLVDDFDSPALLLAGGWIYGVRGGSLVRRRAHEPALLAQLQREADEKSGPPTEAKDRRWIEQTLIRGFGPAACSLTPGPDGWLYLACGSGDHRANAWDDSRAAVLQSGAVFRLRPDGSRLTEFARGFVDLSGGIAFDQNANPWAADGGAAGGDFEFARLIKLVEGGDYGWQNAAGKPAVPDPLRARPGGQRAGTLSAALRLPSRGPCSLVFAPFLPNLLLAVSPAERKVQGCLIDGAGRAQAPFAMLESVDPAFRPVHVAAGPDGAVYIAEESGRIYRLSWSGTATAPAVPLAALDRWSKLAGAPEGDLVSHLESPDSELRRRAANELAKRAPQKLAAAFNGAEKPAPARVAAILASGPTIDAAQRAELEKLLVDPSADVVQAAASVLGDWPPKMPEAIAAAAEELKGPLAAAADPVKQRALQMALGKYAAAAGSVDLAEWTFEGVSVSHGPAMSPLVFDGHVRALELTPGAARELMLGNLDVALNLPETDPKERQRIKEFVTLTAEAMRTRELTEFLDALLRGEENLFVRLEAPLEVRLLACYRNVLTDPPIAADAVAEWLDKNPGGPPEVELAALETMSLVGVKRAGAIDKLADRLLSKRESGLAVAGSYLAGRLAPSLLPKIKGALTAVAKTDPSPELAAALKQLSDLPP